MTRLLAPKSIALVGASNRIDSFGQRVKHLLNDHYYPGNLYLVNPKYQQLEGVSCYPDLISLPETPDLVVLVLGNKGIEAAFDEALALNVGGVVIFTSNYLEQDGHPPLLKRLKQKAREKDIPICGGNGMGFYNYDASTLVSFDFPPDRLAGHIAFIAHSGSVMTYLANTDPRLMFNLVVSPGQEIHGTVADYMLYALAQSTTRVLAIFIETIRDPEQFINALKIARDKNIPVVAVKVGSTEQSARMAASHSGAVAGNDSAFQGICDHYGVIRVADMDALAATALVFSQSRRLGSGGLSSLLDSGGLREQMIDLLEGKYVRFTKLTEVSRDKLKQYLEFGLIPENPVDAMGALNSDVEDIYRNCLKILADDPGTAMVTLEFEFRDNFSQYPILLEVTREAFDQMEKPMVVINSTINANNSTKAYELGRYGISVVNGVSYAVTAIDNLFRYRDQPIFDAPDPIEFCQETLNQWCERLLNIGALGEAESLLMLSGFNLPTVRTQLAENEDGAIITAGQLGYPVVLKSANPELMHKSDVDGVRLSLKDSEAVRTAYQEVSMRLGKTVIIAPMIEQSVELAFGMINDDQFGPIVMVCAGGVYIELLEDRRFIPAPCSPEEALHNIQSLKIFKILQGARGKPACRVDLVAQALSDFSNVAYALREVVAEIDLNPILVTPDDCTIVDALVIGREMN